MLRAGRLRSEKHKQLGPESRWVVAPPSLGSEVKSAISSSGSLAVLPPPPAKELPAHGAPSSHAGSSSKRMKSSHAHG